MNYNKYFIEALNSLKDEGRYRIFNDIKRNKGSFPNATHFSEENQNEVAVWCSNDYLGMGQNIDVLKAMHDAIDNAGAGSGGTRIFQELHTIMFNWRRS